MKNSADLGGCYPPRPSASVDNTLLDLQNSSYPTQPHSIIANYNTFVSGDSEIELSRPICKLGVLNFLLSSKGNKNASEIRNE